MGDLLQNLWGDPGDVPERLFQGETGGSRNCTGEDEREEPAEVHGDNLAGARRVVVGALLLALRLQSTPLSAQRQFSDELQVREVRLLVELPPDRSRLDASEVVVAEGDRQLRVAAAHPLRDGYRVVLFLDGVFSSGRQLHDAALALAQHSAALAGLGMVEVVVADPWPRSLLAATAEAALVEQSLAAIAGGVDFRQEGRIDQLRRDALANAERGGDVREVVSRLAAAERAVVRTQVDRWLSWLGSGCGQGSCVLLLASAGFDVQPEIAYAAALGAPLEGGARPSPELEATVDELARITAAYGWTVLALPPVLQRTGPLDGWQERVGRHTTNVGSSSLFRLPTGHRRPLTPSSAGAYESLVEPDLELLRRLSDASAGAIFTSSSSIPEHLRRLGKRWVLWYQASRSLAGGLSSVEVRLGTSGETMRAPRWVRTGTPAEVPVARLRLLLGEGLENGELELAVELSGDDRVANRFDLHLLPSQEVIGGLDAELSEAWRLAIVAEVGGSFAVLAERRLSAPVPDDGWRLSLELPPGTVRLALAVEELGSGLWGARVVQTR